MLEATLSSQVIVQFSKHKDEKVVPQLTHLIEHPGRVAKPREYLLTCRSVDVFHSPVQPCNILVMVLALLGVSLLCMPLLDRPILDLLENLELLNCRCKLAVPVIAEAVTLLILVEHLGESCGHNFIVLGSKLWDVRNDPHRLGTDQHEPSIAELALTSRALHTRAARTFTACSLTPHQHLLMTVPDELFDSRSVLRWKYICL